MSRIVKDRVCLVVSEVFGVPLEQVNDETSPDTVPNWDSLQHIALIVALEAEFGVSLSPEDAVEMTSVKLMQIILAERGMADPL